MNRLKLHRRFSNDHEDKTGTVPSREKLGEAAATRPRSSKEFRCVARWRICARARCRGCQRLFGPHGMARRSAVPGTRQTWTKDNRLASRGPAGKAAKAGSGGGIVSVITIRHFCRRSAQLDGAENYYDGRKGAPRCEKCNTVAPRITETDECLACSLGVFVSLRSVAVSRDGRDARYKFTARSGRAAKKLFADWPQLQVWLDRRFGRTRT